MGEIPHSEKMFHLPIEVSVYVPSTQDVDKVVSKSEMKLRVDEVKKYLATLFGGFSSSSVEGGFLASDGKVVKENVERVVSFAPKGEFEKNKEALVQKASEWATKWGQEAIGLEHEGDLYYVPQKFENGGTVAIREAKEMANSQALEIKHHASELANALKGNPTIEAWVIAKLERASNDLADVTHYLEGRVQMSGKKMADGGSIYDEDFNGSGQLLLKVDNEAVAKLDYDYDLESAFSEDLNGYKNEFYISNVETKKEFRGKGYAKRLIRQAIEKAKRLGVELISLRRDSGMGCNYGSEYDNYLKKIYESIGFVEKNNDCVMILETKKYADGGSIEPNSKEVQFIKYRDEEIMYDPIFQEFFVNDVMFKTLQEARAFIDKGAPMSDEIKDAYRRGLFKKGGNMKFERPSYKSNYVASQAQQAQAQADANLIADENWNMDYKNDPLLKKKKEAQELGIRAGLAYATRGQSEIVRFQNQAKQQAKQQQATKEQAPEMQETTSTENSAFPEHEVQPELAKMIENNPQMVQMLSGLGGLKGV